MGRTDSLEKTLMLGKTEGRRRDNRTWDGWMASLTQWTWIWVNSGSWWWTRRPGMLQFMGSQRVRHDWATELNWILQPSFCHIFLLLCVLPDNFILLTLLILYLEVTQSSFKGWKQKVCYFITVVKYLRQGKIYIQHSSPLPLLVSLTWCPLPYLFLL